MFHGRALSWGSYPLISISKPSMPTACSRKGLTAITNSGKETSFSLCVRSAVAHEADTCRSPYSIQHHVQELCWWLTSSCGCYTNSFLFFCFQWKWWIFCLFPGSHPQNRGNPHLSFCTTLRAIWKSHQESWIAKQVMISHSDMSSPVQKTVNFVSHPFSRRCLLIFQAILCQTLFEKRRYTSWGASVAIFLIQKSTVHSNTVFSICGGCV